MKTLFIVPSCVNFDPSIELDYSPVRSLYSASERFDQLIESISSIRQYCPSSDIIVSECSNLSDEEIKKIKSKADYLITPSQDNDYIFNFFKNHPNKSHAESFLLLKTLFYLKNIQYPLYDIYFKMSGRYKLNNKFNVHNHVNHEFNCKKHNTFEDGIFTTLFSFNKSFFDLFVDSLLATHSFTTNNYPPYVGFSLETNMLYGLHDRMNFLDELGVEGNFGPDGEFHSE